MTGRTAGPAPAGPHPTPPAVPNTGVTPPPVPSDRARTTERVIGVLALVGTAATVWLGLWGTPPDRTQGDLVRLVYIPPGAGWGRRRPPQLLPPPQPPAARLPMKYWRRP